MCAAAGPLESCGVPLVCSLGATWLHVLVTHQEGCALRGSQRTDTTSARPAQPPRAQRTALRPSPPLRPPLAGAAPGRDACSSSRPKRVDPAGSVGWGLPLQSRPWAEDLDTGRSTRQSRVPSTQSRSPSHLPPPTPSPSNFPFSSSDRSDPLPALPPSKTGAGSPLPAALLSGRAPAAVQRPAAGLSLPTLHLGRDSL